MKKWFNLYFWGKHYNIASSNGGSMENSVTDSEAVLSSHAHLNWAQGEIKRVAESKTESRLIYNYCLKLYRNSTNPHQNAADLMQDTLARAWVKAHTFKNSSKTTSWMISIAYNLFATKCRKLKHRESIFIAVDPEMPEHSYVPDYLEKRLKKQRLALIAKAMPKDKKKRQIVRMRYGKDQSYIDISRTAQIPIGTVKARIHRIMDEVRLGIPHKA
jgi:RNA polymerase sigma-70 factor, ECF subfamily